MAQNLDPNSDGRGVLQFKTGLMSVIKQKLAKRDGASIDRDRDIERLWEFYKLYKRRHRVDDIQKEEQKWRESGTTFSSNVGEILKMRKVFATLRALIEVLEVLSRDADPNGVGRSIRDELGRIKKADATLSAELTPYNIVPLEAQSMTNAIGVFPEVRGAVQAIRYTEHFPRLPDDFEISGQRDADMFDLLEYIFGFQRDNVRNQREHLVLTLSNAQSQLSIPGQNDPKIDENAVNEVFLKVLDNYIKWCKYLRIRFVYNKLEAIDRDRKLFLVSLYFLIWGEAANMAKELDAKLDHGEAVRADSCLTGTDTGSVSFLERIICPIYETISAEAARNNGGKAAHSEWRNYDDFNEYFWTPACFELGWPMKTESRFLSKPKGRKRSLTIIAFRKEHLDIDTFKILLSAGPTYAIMNFIECLLDVVLMYGAYSMARGMAISRLVIRYVAFWLIVLASKFTFAYFLQARSSYSSNNHALTIVSLWAPVLAIYLMDIHIWYTLLSAIIGGVMGAKARLGEIRSIEMVHKRFESFPEAFAQNLVSPVVKRVPLGQHTSQVSDKLKLSVPSLCVFITILALLPYIATPMFCSLLILHYILSVLLFFNLSMVGHCADCISLSNFSFLDGQDMNKAYAAMFSPFWNEIIKSLREEDYLSNREMDLLSIPSNTGSLRLVQWPLFLLCSKILVAIDLAMECKETQEVLWRQICDDEYMAYAVQECYYSVEKILNSMVNDEGRRWYSISICLNLSTCLICQYHISNSIEQGSLAITLNLKKLQLVVSRFTALTGLLKIRNETPDLAKGAAKAMFDFYEVVTHDLLSHDLREQLDTWNILARARNEGRLFSRIAWPRDPEIIEQVKRLHLLLTVKDAAANVPKNLEARRRLEFFTNSLFMDMPQARPVAEMVPFSVFTPYYSETVLYSSSELRSENEDGISILFYLQKIFPDEWENFLERIGRSESTGDADLQASSTDALELRFWVSYRGQTLARTVRGMMYYRRALMLQSFLERRGLGVDDASLTNMPRGFESSIEARAQADLKFTYVVSCQIYGQQKQQKKPEATDIGLLLQRYEALRVAFIHSEDVGSGDGGSGGKKEFYSKLVKADIHGKDEEIYSIKLPGDPKLGEGKPENQNHAIVFTRGEAIQTIDMNQDNYLEEAIKMRNLLEEFHGKHGIRRPTILGVREHVFTGSVSSLAWFMSNQETSFVTLGQRVLAYPLKATFHFELFFIVELVSSLVFRVRMHYGHPDVFDRIFHITRGGISKASRVINISEDIYAGRDVGLNQIALFEGKVAGGNGEQVLSRDVYRIGQLFDFFRMMSFYFTTVGFYVCTMMTVLTVYVFLYGRVYLAFSGADRAISRVAKLSGNTALDAALNAQFLVQIGVFTAVPMVMGFILELGLLKAIFSFITMQFQLCSVFFTFSLGTRTHYFGRTILHGGAKYRATGRGFVVQHIKFADNYRLYSRSHFVKAFEVALLLIIYIAYGYTDGGASSFVLLTISSWFLVISWLFAPYIFNPSGFEWQKTVEDFEDWVSWLMYKGGVGVKGELSWESWWEEEQAHIQTLRGRILESILSLRFFMFQYGIVYKLDLTGKNTSLALYGYSWVILLVIVFLFKGVASLTFIALIVVAIALTPLSIPDMFACVLGFIPTGWGLLSLAITWKQVLRVLGLWETVREFGRIYDAAMGMLIFSPIALLSWFPFISTFQSRLLFNQAFSRGLEISIILAGNRANVET
ncbi:hypothetical protein ARALYDRAFT_482666 [Arabidopsis lyrata subsp. lyrata]|uniref:1,3-beta-glucan synthase n=1 Tax=Arabidopsis lyrata subsp. lyrata TaxID=81972 RepID=D7LJ83_ARALL|nr:hypothetical protein ARALYDRAFT_482666 [Arabidopsis lyrata subsp. lyrata]